jgi:hypothetical protein
VTLSVGATQAAAITISGAPQSLIAGTSTQLGATLVNVTGGVTWSATAGTITPGGRYTAPAAPPPGGRVTITAKSTLLPAVQTQVSFSITPAPAQVPAPGGPGTGPVIAVDGLALPKNVVGARLIGALSSPKLLRNGRNLAVRVTPTANGKLLVTAIRSKHAVARCGARARMGRTVACKMRLPKRFAHKPVRVAVVLKTTGGTATQYAFSRP